MTIKELIQLLEEFPPEKKWFGEMKMVVEWKISISKKADAIQVNEIIAVKNIDAG